MLDNGLAIPFLGFFSLFFGADRFFFGGSFRLYGVAQLSICFAQPFAAILGYFAKLMDFPLFAQHATLGFAHLLETPNPVCFNRLDDSDQALLLE
jgi:hypothetical protein